MKYCTENAFSLLFCVRIQTNMFYSVRQKKREGKKKRKKDKRKRKRETKERRRVVNMIDDREREREIRKRGVNF